MSNHSVSYLSSTFPPEILLQHESIFVNTSINYATVALILYEYLAHLPAEVAYFWGRKITGASLLFFANRYLVLVYSVALLRGAAPFTKLASLSLFSLQANADTGFQSCAQWTNGVRVLEILSYVPWAAFSSLRVYALRGYARGWPLATFVFLLSIVPVCINFIDFKWASMVLDPLWGCSEAILEPPELSIRRAYTQPLSTVTIVSRVSLVLADFSVIVRTWTWMSSYEVGKCLKNTRGTLSAVFLKNGTIYFVILALLNLLHLAFCASSIFQSAAYSRVSDVIALIEPLTSILVSRFMLSLQAAYFRPYAHTDSVRASATSDSLHFEAVVVGSIGVLSPSSPSALSSTYDEDDDNEESGAWYDADSGAPPAYAVAYGRGEPESGCWGPGDVDAEDPFHDAEAAAGSGSGTASNPRLK